MNNMNNNMMMQMNMNNKQFSNINNINNMKDMKILELQNELDKANKIIEQQKSTITNLQNQLNNLNNYNYNNNINLIQSYQNIINQKEQEINELKLKLQNNNPQVGEYVNMNKMMAVNFISTDSKLHFAVPCVETNTFAEVEEILYKQFPEYRETNNTFMANGGQVLRFKTIKENKIGNGLPVTMVIP